MRRFSTHRVLPPLLALLAACGGADGHPARVDRPERLDGRWSVALRLEEPMQLHGDTVAAGTVRGEIALIDNPAVRVAPGLGGTPTHYGVYAADFARFGFAAGAGQVPTAVARLLDADSVEIALDPAPGRPVVLAGRLAGDSVAGHWRYAWGRSAAAAGRFVMRRR
ncbi:MAG TPA: hypothetical protein VM890_02965 [Longimicrobium sp.]|jgi:hypothetical protein|nr:hypothetical protein [Longimicrobium sp.]